MIKNKIGKTVEKPFLNIRFGKFPANEKTNNKGKVPRPNNSINRKLLLKEFALTAEAKAI